MNASRCKAVLLLLSITAVAIYWHAATHGGIGSATADDAANKTPPWVTMSDPEFCTKYFDEATGDQDQRSRFAWQLFARINQQVKEPSGTGTTTYSAWELWASNPSTFSDPPKGAPTSRKGPVISHSAKVQITGQETNRNATSYDYIVKNGFFDRTRTEQALTKPNPNGSPKIDFPIGAIETKVQWVTLNDTENTPGWNSMLKASNLPPVDKLPADMYQIIGDGGEVYGLVAVHIMAKIAVSPDGPLLAEDPSWFWATFEYYDNPNRKYLVGFETYQDTLTYAEQKSLLTSAGLDDTKFAIPVNVPVFDSTTGKTSTVPGNNYLCNGTQYRFVGPDPKTGNTVNVILGNSVLEAQFTVPSPPGSINPFRGWNASCHSCHFESSGNSQALPRIFHAVTGEVSLGVDSTGEKLLPIDFKWSIPINAIPLPPTP